MKIEITHVTAAGTLGIREIAFTCGGKSYLISELNGSLGDLVNVASRISTYGFRHSSHRRIEGARAARMAAAVKAAI